MKREGYAKLCAFGAALGVGLVGVVVMAGLPVLASPLAMASAAAGFMAGVFAMDDDDDGDGQEQPA